jgi:glutamate decarboxylase
MSQQNLVTPVFSHNVADDILSVTKMTTHASDSKVVFEMLNNKLILDGFEKQNLATFCQTWLEPQALKLLEIGATRNQIDKTLYPQSAELEVRCVNILADLWNSPEAANATGTASTGSSEACMLGGLALKWQWRKKKDKQKGKILLNQTLFLVLYKFVGGNFANILM